MSETFSSLPGTNLAQAIAANSKSPHPDGGTEQTLLSDTLIELAPDAIFIADPAGRFIEVNARACEQLGYSREELLEKTIADILAAEELPRLRTAEAALVPGISQTAIWTHLHKDGSRIPVEVSVKILPDGRRVAFVRDLRDRLQFEDEHQAALLERNQAQADLRLSEARLQLALQATQSGLWDWDIVNNCAVVTQEYCTLMGFDPSVRTVSDQQWLSQIHPDDRLSARQRVAQAIQTGEAYADEYRVLHPDGIRWISSRGRAYYDAAGNPIQMIGHLQETTARKQTEAALQQKVQEAEAAQQTLAALMAYIPEGITIADAPDVTIRQVSQYGQQLTGRLPEAIEGIPAELHAENWGIFYPDGITPAANEALPLTRAVQQGEVVTNEEWILRRPDGQSIVMLCNAGPIYSGQGEITGGIIAWRDITEWKQTEVALREKEQQLQQLSDSMPQFVWMSNAQGELDYVNRQWIEYSGLTPEQSRDPEQIAAVHHPDDVQRAFEQWARAQQTKQPYEFEARFRRAANGTYRWFLVRGVPVLDEQGQILRWYGTSTDIHDRKQAEAALQQSEDRYRMAVASAKLGTWDWDLVTNELKWDAACKAMFGILPDAESDIDVFYAALHPDDRDRVTEVVQNALNPASGGSYDIEYRTLGIEDGIERWVAAKGQAYFSSSGQTVRFIGTVLDITEVKQQEVERQLAQAALRDQQERLQAALFAAGTGTFRWDLHTNALDWDDNLDRLFGLLPGETVRSLDAFIQRVHPDDRQGVIDRCVRCAAEGADFDMDFRVVYPDGSLHWLSDKGKTVFDADGTPAYMTGACVDITDRKQAELEREQFLIRVQAARQEAEQVNRLKDDFFSALSHELRTPLNPILGWTKMLQGQKLTPDRIVHALDTIERNVRHQISLVDDLLDVSRIIQGKMRLDSHPVDLVPTVAAAIETVQFAAQAKGITIQFVHPDAVYTSGDGDRLQQVFWNLLSNAIKFTPIGGSVEVRLERVEDGEQVEDGEMGRWGDGEMESSEGVQQAFSTALPPDAVTFSSPHPLIPPPPHPPTPTYAQITITDTGIGIAPDFLPHIFEYFRQAEGGSTRKYGGLGLGLAIVRHLVELHGGTIMAESSGLGQGAMFIVRLPLLDHRPLAQPLSSSSEKSSSEKSSSEKTDSIRSGESFHSGFPFASESPTSSGTVARSGKLSGVQMILVDDEPDNLELLRFILNEEGATTLTFTSPLAALEAIAKSPPDLLVSDIGMPELSGYEFIQRVRTLPSQAARQVSAIALTAFAQSADQKRALSPIAVEDGFAAGYQAFLAKPIDPDQVIATAAALLS